MRAMNAQKEALVLEDSDSGVPRIMSKMATMLRTFDAISNPPIFSPITKTANMHTIIGFREHTTPMVETLKYLTAINAIYTQTALYDALQIRGTMVDLSTGSMSCPFRLWRLPITINTTIKAHMIPLIKVS